MRYEFPSLKKYKFVHDLSDYPFIEVVPTMYDKMRILHNYRNISRSCKQFLMNDKFLEQITITLIRNFYYFPHTFSSPLLKYPMIFKYMADHSDMHYSLISHNQHPIQLLLYDNYNKYIRELSDPLKIEEKKQILDLIK